ncbi:MAG: LytTR family DNA-binding domain-containing protein [Chitinophagaceae bacterium]|nr:LytTR family DNA-binding domain-containing protein [Chitinophagaceae bacterium]
MNDQDKIQCLVVDDEPPARELVTRYIKQVPNLALQCVASNALEAMSMLQKFPVDLMFLDINMPQLNGIDFLKTLKHPPKVILTTAYAEYALDGYELDVVDYLMKPIPFDRFLKAVNKAFDTRPQRQFQTLSPEEKTLESFVYFRADRKMVKVMLHDILYVESMKDYIKVFTKQGLVITKQSIRSVEAMLPEREFMRVHRSYLVSLKHVQKFSNDSLEIGKIEIPIGKLYRQSVIKQLGV